MHRAKAESATLYDLDSISVVTVDDEPLVRGPLEVVTAIWDPKEEEVYQGLLGMNWLTLFDRVCFQLDRDPPMLELHVPS